ncbi:MAG: FMN-binding glutamate synthase family protein, partial [Bradyrhizobiaceae bacterium]|nr:FMN-binding glutamate synthase family protein [Bradyrhizobiaceae bacterium]
MRLLRLAFSPRFIVYSLCLLAALALAIAVVAYPPALEIAAIPLAACLGLAALGTYDVFQARHALRRNYPVSAHLRFLFEAMRPEMRQYFFESDKDGTPFSRDKRSVVYQRAKLALDKRPFGTQHDVYAEGFEWVRHSMVPRPIATTPFRTRIGGADCQKPYDASVFNISALSFGALSPNAIRALNKGARAGNFAHDTGEGGFSAYHREHGGDIIWQVASGYFGTRNSDGTFSPERFAETATLDQVRMIELKISQGAKPGHGGVLPAAKVSAEIARSRGVPVGEDCISPSSHSCFSTPVGMMEFIAKMRRLSGGKPVGFKLCVGHPWEFLAVCKAMLVTGIYPDFIVVDGKEGGTGAAPL